MTHVPFPFSMTPLDPEITEELVKEYQSEVRGFVEVGPKKYIFPLAYMNHAEHLYNVEARPDDIFVCTHPRSGTTLIQEMTWLLAYDLDYERAQRESLLKRSLQLDFCALTNDSWLRYFSLRLLCNPSKMKMLIDYTVPAYKTLPNFESPRIIKTHLPFSLLPPSIMTAQAKVIYIARNPKDMLVSYYYFHRKIRDIGFTSDFGRFFDYFEKNLLGYSPYWEHIKEGWELRHEPNVLFLFYEEVTADMPAAIRKVSKFLDKTLTDDEVERLADHLHIDNFRNNVSVNLDEFEDFMFPDEQPFVRNGKTTLNGWPEEFTPEMAERLEALIEKNLKDSSLKIPGC